MSVTVPLPNKDFTREKNLNIIATNAKTVADATKMVMELRVELGNLFPTETYGNGCGGTCGRFGCIGNCIIQAWDTYFTQNYEWQSKEKNPEINTKIHT
jgi:hypothetical protein